MNNNIKYNLKLGLLNVRSLNTGQDELLISINKYLPDILALNETWLKEGEEKFSLVVPGYVLKHRPRPKGLRGGGVGFFVRKGLRVIIKQHPISLLEQLWLELSLPGGRRVVIGTAYRPESVPVGVAIEALDESVSMFAYCNHLFLLTDFNVDFHKQSKSNTLEVMNFFSQRNLKLVVHEPTRINDKTASLLDIIVTDSPELCINVSVYHNNVLSDHAMVISEVNIRKPKDKPVYISKRFLDKINHETFIQDLESLPWHIVLKSNNINEKVQLFNNLILTLFDKHAPVKQFKAKTALMPWITNTIKLMMTLRDEALNRANTTKIDSHRVYYKSLRNLVNSALDREKTAYFAYFVNNNTKNPKEMWKQLKSTCSFPSAVKPEIPKNLCDPDKINNFFLDLPRRSSVDQDVIRYFKSNRFNDKSFEITTVGEDEIFKILSKISTQSAGHDTISVQMLRLTLSITLPIITAIVNDSIRSKIFPDKWKIAKIIPIPKATQVEQYKDLRPISILPIISKVIERVVCKQLTDYVEKERILPDTQSGFRRGYSTASALAHVTDDILLASDQGLGSILVLLDFSRAFDYLNRDLLIAKLQYYGITKNTCGWFSSFLTNRYQYVEIASDQGSVAKSELMPVPRGTPQGSVLSPILFTLFTSDLVKSIKHCKIHLYADDTQLYFSFKHTDTPLAVKAINDDLCALSEWANKNTLFLNPEKSKFMILGTKNQCNKILQIIPPLKVNGIVLDKVDSARNLGLILDSDMRYIEHVNIIIRNAYYRLKMLYRIRKYLSETVRKSLVDSVVLSQFNYCDTVYGPRLLKKTKKAIQRVQNACTRFCYNIPKRAHVTPYLNLQNTLKMESRRKLHMTCLVHKIVFQKKPNYLFDKFEWLGNSHEKYTRSKEVNLMCIPNHKTAGYRGCFKFSAAKIWNDLPPPHRKSMSHLTFKNRIKQYMITQQRALHPFKIDALHT